MRKMNGFKTATKIIILLGVQMALIASFIVLININNIAIGLLSGICAFVVLALPSVILFSVINSELTKPIKIITSASRSITENQAKELKISVNNELRELVSNLKNIDTRITNATAFARNIGDGKFDMVLDIATKDFELGTALDEMREKLKNVAEEESKRNWANEGMAKFSQLFRDHQNDDLKEFAYIIILNIVKYLNANQGAVFIVNEADADDTYIELLACYAYDKRKYKDRRIELAEGLIGQCIADKDTLYISDIPEDYISITSGLGSATPKTILLVPLKTSDHVFGAIELASFEEIEPYQIEFVNEIAESFSSTLSSARINQHTQKLLMESQKMTNDLRSKENELVTNEEELRAAQDTLNNKLIELQAETNLTKCILDAINKSNAAIEFDMDGNILNANEMFLSVMGYDKNEIIGCDEKIMVPEDEINSTRYEMLWDSLKKGNFNTGEFRRYSKSRKEIWVDATYNPILDLRGEPYKILMFANFTTESKEKEHDYRNRLNALNETFGTIEINLDFTIKSANYLFLEQLKLKRKEIKNLSFKSLIDTKFNSPGLSEYIKETLANGNPVRQHITIVSTEGFAKDYFIAVYISKSITGSLASYFALLIPSIITNSSS